MLEEVQFIILHQLIIMYISLKSIYQINMMHDVDETASFLPHYDRAIILMRWVRRSIKEDTIIKLK